MPGLLIGVSINQNNFTVSKRTELVIGDVEYDRNQSVAKIIWSEKIDNSATKEKKNAF